MEFQIYDYVEDHEKQEEESSDSEEKQDPVLPEYIIHVFGRTLDDKSVYCKIQNFTPHFYIKLPSKWTKSDAKSKIKIMEKWFHSYDNKKVWKKFRAGLQSMDLVVRKEAIGFTNDKDFLFARMVFTNSFSMKKFRYMLEQNKINIPRVTTKNYQFKTYEANLMPMLRCFHIKKITGCSWVRVEKYKLIEQDSEKNSYCNIEINVDWRNIEPITKERNAPLRIASFDIECYSAVTGQFPMARKKSDQVIQIGTDYIRLGESKPFRQHIVCLDKTDPVKDVDTEWYDNERDLVLAWKKEVIRSDCDIITGYNIFFFDEKYVYDRCELHLGIKTEMSLISKLKNYECRFRDFKLASSALGENMIKYWDTPGRIHVDLMKDVQKTYNLSSYKLDMVAANFIRGKIVNLEKKKDKYLLHCENINDITENDYIHIEHVKSFVSDNIGTKYLVKKIDEEKKTLLIKSDIELKLVDEGYLFWSQAKDDVTPADIFRFQKGTSADRSIVAKYCVKDCRLVNLLVSKLEVITKNIEMANVCYVPLSYLFVRGQGIKLFSLCLKCYREHGYLFPVLTKDDSINSGYEGAIVFDPIPDVDYQALVTKDFASLYPSSILQKNMSHETIILCSDYDCIEGVKYYNAEYKQSDGTIKHVRFAQKDGKLGVVPTILSTLLGERKSVKKQMKTEKDQFKYKIKDAKQLALKTTANSLYGQLGAPTSAVYLKAIAACTTSTGREMLILAKKYDEEILPGFLNGLKYAYEKEDDEMVNKLLDMELKDRDNDDLISKIKTYVTEKMSGKIFQPVIRYGDTDSIFTCFRMREECKKVKKKHGLEIWKEIVSYSKDFILFFMPSEHRDLWCNLHEEYYGDDKITKVELPDPPEVLPKPDHWKILLPIEDRMKQFLKEYMEESYMPWLWTIQELYHFYKEKFNEKQFDEFLEIKLYKMGESMIEKINLIAEDLIIYDTDKNGAGKLDNIDFLNDIKFDNHKFIKTDICIIKEYLSIFQEKDKHVESLEKEEKLERLLETKTLLTSKLEEFIEKVHDDLDLDQEQHIAISSFHLFFMEFYKIDNVIKNIKKKIYEEKLVVFLEKIRDIWIEPYWYVKKNKKVKIKLWKEGKAIIDKRNLDLSIEMGVISGETVKKHLPFPHDLEYEKTFWPFLILTKKRYVGNKYEFDLNKFKQDFMGIVLKRRDNSPIVKEICNGIIDALINFKDPEKAKQYTIDCVKNMFENKYDVNYFLTSKTLKLKESYKDWTRIAHVVLAERIGIRDPGNKPQSGDRISYAAIKIPNKSKDTLQGDMIETPDFIKEQELQLDYLFYMTNQIMNPALQFLDLAIKNAEDIFNPYIYRDKIDELYKEKYEIQKFIAEAQKKEFVMSGGVDYVDYNVNQLLELMEELKKEVRTLRCDKRKLIRLLAKESILLIV